MNLRRVKFSVFVLLIQIIFLVLFGVFGEYGSAAQPKEPVPLEDFATLYSFFRDINVMVFVGFGFLATFLKRYGFCGMSLNLLIAAFVVQWALLVRGFIYRIAQGYEKFPIHLEEMLYADFAAVTVLISMGAVLGKTSPLQLVVMAVIEVILSQLNEYVGRYRLGAVDAGKSMYIHVFGAYFGLAVARVIRDSKYKEAISEGRVYHSDIFAMIGTLFLWLFLPSFNGGVTGGDEQHRAIVNTYLALASCTVVSFAFSQIYDSRGRFNMVHIQNATLAGGVALGTSANMPLQPWAALLTGCIAGVVSVYGNQFITPYINRNMKIHDTRGVNNLHGLPGILAVIVSAICAVSAGTDTWGESMYEIFPWTVAREPQFMQIKAKYPTITEPGLGRTAIRQGGYQILGLIVTMAIAIPGGILTGLLMRQPCFDNINGDQMYDDRGFFIIEGQGFPYGEDDSFKQEPITV